MLSGACLIDGTWLMGEAESFDSTNPANGSLLWQGHAASLLQIDDAAASARRAFASWSMTSLEERYQVIKDFVARLEADKQPLAELISRETGKPIWEAKTEVASSIAKAEISLEAYQQRSGEQILAQGTITTKLVHRPQGVLVVLGPFNLPMHLPNGQIIPALLAGNCVLFKPSELTPCIAEAYAKHWQQAGLPQGVLQLLQGGGEVGQALLQTDVNGVLFTGSYQTGAAIHRAFAGRPEVLLALEMGGNNPLIVDKVGDAKAAAYHIIQSAFITSGQRCTCARRLVLTRGKANEAVISELLAMAKQLLVAEPNSTPEPFMGAMIQQKAALETINTQQQLAIEGGEVLLSAKALGSQQTLVSPGIVDVTSITNRADKECFGPLLQVIWVDDFNQAIDEANSTAFGLSAGLLSDDQARYAHFSSQIRAGIVNWNRPLTGASSKAPFGGIGRSGNHRPAAFYMADHCAYPMASLEQAKLSLPEQLPQGVKL